MMYLVLVLTCAVVVIERASAGLRLTRRGIPLADIPYSPTMSAYIGIQPSGSSSPSIEANVTAFADNPCDTDMIGREPRYGGAVLIPGSIFYRQCSNERIALNFASVGAAALIVIGQDGVQGAATYYHDGTKGQYTSHLPIMFITAAPADHTLLTDLVSRSPEPAQLHIVLDDNLWATSYSSWSYIIAIRIVPPVLYLLAGVQAISILSYRILILHDNYLSEETVQRRSLRRWLRSFYRNGATIPNVTLLVELIVNVVLAVVLAVGGIGSTGNLSRTWTMMFVTQLTGLGFACDLLAGEVWSQLRRRGTTAKPSLLWRTVRGWGIAFVLVASVGVDLVTCLVCASHEFGHWAGEWVAANIVLSGAVLLTLVQFVLALHFLHQALQFIRESKSVRMAVTNVKSNNRVDAVLDRLSRWLVGLGLCMLGQFGTVFLAAKSLVTTIPGFKLYFSLIGCLKACCSICRVNLFRSQRVRDPAHVSTLKGSALKQPTMIMIKSSSAAVSGGT